MAARPEVSSSTTKKLGAMSGANSKSDQILSVENVFTVLNKVAKGWRWVAEEILLISSSTCKEIEDVYITQEKCLQQAITFWFQRYVFASWRFLLVWLDDKGEEEVSREVRQASESESIPEFTIEGAFSVLNKIPEGWRWVAESILLISSEKCDELQHLYASQEECLKEAIKFRRDMLAFAPWRFLTCWLDIMNKTEISNEIRHLAERRTEFRLTPDNVFTLLKRNEKGWRWTAEQVLLISSSKCDDIQSNYKTEDECLQQVITFWIERCVFASWRLLIYRLDNLNDQFANEMRHLAEPITDSSMTIQNLEHALESVSDDDFSDAIDMPPEVVDAFQHLKDGGKNEFKKKLLELGLNGHPLPSWEFLSGRLHRYEHVKAVEEVQKFFKKNVDSSLTVENVVNALKDVEDWSSTGLPWHIDIPKSKIEEVENMYPDDLELRKKAFIQYWLKEFPYPCWERICYALFWLEEYDVLQRVQEKYFIGTYEMRRHFKAAMEKGKAKTKIAKVVLFGAGGSGKTCTTYVVLDKVPPENYSSTPLARPATVYCIEVQQSSETPKSEKWMKLEREGRDKLIAQACHFYTIDQLVKFPHVTSLSIDEILTRATKSNPKEAKQSSARAPKEEVNSSNVPVTENQMSEVESNSFLSSLEAYEHLLKPMGHVSVKDIVTEIKRVQLADCGGQPRFHEILPIFIRDPTLYLFVFKLNEELCTYPKVAFYEDGKPISEEYTSTETVEQLFEHCLRVIRSQKALDETKKSQIMIIGTHRDREHECTSESRSDKNEKFVELLLPEFSGEIKYNPLRVGELIFPLNAQTPGDEDKHLAQIIRNVISENCFIERDIPLQWHAFEAVLEGLSLTLGRGVLSIEECITASQHLQFDDETAVHSALLYLDRLNLVFYYPDIIPNAVFVRSQVLLDKITELVKAAHESKMENPL